jgi:hypothetical protein
MPPELNTEIAHSARIYDYLLGGKDNFAADRAAAEKMLKHTPSLPISMRANRRFMAKVARYLVEQGIRQFLDVGTGLPTQPNLHEVVQGVAPEAAVVYVDNDPLVLVHARALLMPAGTGAVSYLDADLRQPEAILASAADVLDLTRPVALTLIAVLQHITDDDNARGIITSIMDRLAPGSALALSTVTTENDPDAGERTITTYNQSGVPVVSRPRSTVEALFADFHVVNPPGVVPVHHWMPTEQDRALDDKDVYMYGGVAFKR